MSDSATTMEAQRTQYALIEGHRIAYKEMGTGKPLLLLHGIPTNNLLWSHVMPKLADQYRVIAPDMLNYGESDKPENADVSINAQARIMDKFMDAVGMDAADIVAHDIGGGVGQLMAINYGYRVQRLVLIDSICFDSWPIPEFEKMLEPGVEESTTVEEFTDNMQSFMPNGVYDEAVITDEMVERYVGQWNSAEGKAAFFRNLRRLNKEYTQAIAGELKTIQAKTLILWGEEDNFQKPKYAPKLKKAIPGATLIWVEQAGHWVTDEKPGLVTQHILTFLEE